MAQSIEKDGIWYTATSNDAYYYVGTTNSSFEVTETTKVAYKDVDSHRAIRCSESECSSIKSLVIPKKINGKPVLEIGSAAFAKLFSLQTVHINAQVTRINQLAFYGCTALTSINIPSTVQVIGFCAISAIASQDTTSNGLLTVKFEPNSTITEIQRYGIERKEHIIIYYCGYTAPKIKQNSLFYGAKTKIVFSPIQLSWSELATEADPAVCSVLQEPIICNKQQTLTCKNNMIHLFSTILCFTFILSKE